MYNAARIYNSNNEPEQAIFLVKDRFERCIFILAEIDFSISEEKEKISEIDRG